ncbi:MAG TPA: hypothetical protein VK807_23720 [Gemmatimonadaceae bacterium]|jgi:hypothetical protein|nr:hypothetical protein [Gemmatimonadaceae bacterium]
MPEQESHPHRAVDSFVFLITCGFLVPPFVTWLVLSSRDTQDQTAFTIFAPFASAIVLFLALLLIEAVEKRIAGSRPGWPNALYAIPVATIASGLAFAVVDPGHHWWRDGLAGLAWGTGAAVIGWRRWNARAAQTATVGEAPR